MYKIDILMSFNRSKYDTCSYKQNLQENVSTLSYILSPMFHEHKNKCRHQLGFIGGTSVSHIKGNLVDLDSELRGQTRYISKCGNNQYVPTGDGIIQNDKTPPINTTALHLPACQSIMYRSIPLPPKMNYNNC
jgi:hypothetical protein